MTKPIGMFQGDYSKLPDIPPSVPFVKTTRAEYRKQAKILKDSGRFDTLPQETKTVILDRMKKLGIPWETL